MRSKIFCCCSALLLLLSALPLRAVDFGLITNHYVEFGGNGSDAENQSFKYQSDILPRLSFLVGGTGEGIVSAGVTLGWDDKFYVVPELLRTELSMRFNNNRIKFGRISYADPLGFIASGLFDGVQFSHYSTMGTFNVGAWYTGLLYKKNANITMTGRDQARYDEALDFNRFSDTYFASRRLLASFDWEHPSLAELIILKAALTGQADLSNEDTQYHSEYLTLKAGIPIKQYLFEVGGSLEIAQAVADDEQDNTVAFALSMGVFWTLPTSFHSRLSLTGNIAGGRVNDNDAVGAFVPITTTLYGDVLQAKLSGITALGLQYTARLRRDMGASLSVSHFVRNDTETYRAYPVRSDTDSGYALGTELFGRFIWSPLSDLQVNIGGGSFLPALGNVAQDAKAQWLFELAVIIAFL